MKTSSQGYSYAITSIQRVFGSLSRKGKKIKINDKSEN